MRHKLLWILLLPLVLFGCSKPKVDTVAGEQAVRALWIELSEALRDKD